MELYKYRVGRGVYDDNHKEAFYRDIDLLAVNRIYVPLMQQLNDPTEGLFNDTPLFDVIGMLNKMLNVNGAVENLKKAFDDFVEKINTSGVYSLSRDVNNELMWSYYANGHNGYAIIFDSDKLYDSFCKNVSFQTVFQFNVVYKNSLPKINTDIFKEETTSVIQKFIGYKSKAWEHEKETRVIFDKGGEVKEFDYRILKGFVFGYKMPKPDRQYIMEKFAGRGMKYYEMKLNPNNYKFYKVEIDDEFKNAEAYYPHKVEYDLEELIQGDCGNIAKYHRNQIKDCLEYVSIEPFVKSFNYIFCQETEGKLEVLVFVDFDKPGVLKRINSYKFVSDGNMMVLTESIV